MPFKIGLDLALLLLSAIVGIARNLLQREPVRSIVGLFYLGIAFGGGALFRFIPEIRGPQLVRVKCKPASLGSGRCPGDGKRSRRALRLGRFCWVWWRRDAGGDGRVVSTTAAASSCDVGKQQQCRCCAR